VRSYAAFSVFTATFLFFLSKLLHVYVICMYSSVEVQVMTHAIGRCWSHFDAISSSSGDAPAAAALAAVEESAFIVGSSSMRALQTRCVMVAVVFMNRSFHPSNLRLNPPSCRP
jgi:hypothetical protein